MKNISKTLKVCVFTGSRSDFDRLYWVCREIERNSRCRLHLVAAHAHFSKKFGMTIRQVRASGLKVSAQVKMFIPGDSRADISKSVGIGAQRLTDVLTKLNPDIVVVLGDRYELLSVVCACSCLNIPLAHIGGGQTTQGAIDDQIRHIVTKASHIHFAANKDFAQNIIKMGEEPWRVFVTGSPSIDSLAHGGKLSCRELSRELKIDLSKPTALVAYHPTTLEFEKQKENNREFFKALKDTDMQFLLTYPNSDFGSQEIIKNLKQLSKTHRYPTALAPNLGNLRYRSALKCIKLMIGNSSSGIIEAPAFNVPVVNVGTRQLGRPMAKSIFNCDFRAGDIKRSIQKALSYRGKNAQSPWGDGNSSRRIVQCLVKVMRKSGTKRVLNKRLYVKN